MSFLSMPDPFAARRLFLGRTGGVLSGAAVALLAGNHRLAAAADAPTAGDAQILNTALGAELEAIAAYQVGAESKLLQKPALDLADRVGKELAAMGVTTASPSLRRISAQIASIGLRR